MERVPKVPAVAAYATAVGWGYESTLQEYEGMSADVRADVDRCHAKTPEGRVNEAWAAYRIAKRGGEFARQGFAIYKADGTAIRFPDAD